MTVKMPEPMTAPMPRAVSDHGPRVFLSLCSGSSDSRMSLSIDLRASSWLGRAVLLVLRAGTCQCWRTVLALGFRISLRRAGTLFDSSNVSYRFDWPRVSFLIFFLLAPRAPVRFALGAAFLRAVRFSFFRSSLSSIFVVSATRYLSSLKSVQGFPQISRLTAYLSTGSKVYVNREFIPGQNGLRIAFGHSSAFSSAVPSVSKVQSNLGLKTGSPARFQPPNRFGRVPHYTHQSPR